MCSILSDYRKKKEANWLNNGYHISVSTKLMLWSKFIVRHSLRKAKIHPAVVWRDLNSLSAHARATSRKTCPKNEIGPVEQGSLSFTQRPHICCRENFA
jgi:hypothetical protein